MHRWLLRTHAPRGLAAGFGHDAATLAGRLVRPVACVDLCIEGVHFERRAGFSRAAAKAALRALSDLAAAAALPRALLFSASFGPRDIEQDVRAAIRAVSRTARCVGAELIAGDLACSAGPVVFSITAVGELGPGAPPPGRDRARAGDWLLSTGPFGGSLLGRHLRIRPRLAAGRTLWLRGVRAMTDVSDGLVRDASRLADRSGLQVRLDAVPIHRDALRAARVSGRSALEHALYDGEDHELLVCASPGRARALLALKQDELRGLVRVGSLHPGRGVLVPRDAGALDLVPADPLRGWTHGAR